MSRQNISQLELGKLKNRFPNLLEIVTQVDDPIDIIRPCTFDHYLEINECDTIVDKTKDIERRIAHKKMLQLFFKSSDEEVYSWRYKRKNKIHFYKISSLEYLLKISKIDTKSGLTGCNYHLISPKLQVIYEEHWDWTNIISLFPESNIDEIKKITEESGLYLLR